MNIFFRNIIILVCTLVAVSCYKDLGNYDYRDINEITIDPGSYTYSAGVPSEVVITPKVTQSMTEGTDNLSYLWQRPVSGNRWEEVGTGPQYVLQVSGTDDQVIRLIFSVTDNNLGITTYSEIDVRPIIAFESCWFLLQDIDGQAVLGNVDGEGDERTVNSDIYGAQNGGQDLQGSPLFLGVHPYMRTDPPTAGNSNTENLLGVFTSSERYILEASSMHGHPDLDYDRIVYGRHLSGENMPQNDGSGPTFMKGQRNGFAIADGGTLWYAVHDDLALMYPLRLDPATLGSDPYAYTAGDVCLSYARGNNLVMYDSRGNRFLKYINTADYGSGYWVRQEIVEGGGSEDNQYLEFTSNNTSYLTPVGENGQANAFNPDRLQSGLVMDCMGMSTSGQGTGNVLAIGHSGSTFHVYELSMDAIVDNNDAYARCSGYWSVSAEGSLVSSGKVPAATSSYFTRMFFYAAGNAIYRVDVSLATPTVTRIWASDDASDVVTGLKFKSDNEEIYYEDNTVKGVTHQLGAIVQGEDGVCVLVEFNMTAAGEIEQDSAGVQNIKVFGEDADGDAMFSNVVDFIYSYRDAIY